ncbi:hypothetical protein BRC70_07270 [Halobacteriales archaeon QH_6_68_27]|nr:MAG: hypothetical protein BRC70_07270 [Halobacteriales archaeon QH_6_68_27]
MSLDAMSTPSGVDFVHCFEHVIDDTKQSKRIPKHDELDGRPHLVVADVSRDEAWAAVEEPAAVALEEWA